MFTAAKLAQTPNLALFFTVNKSHQNRTYRVVRLFYTSNIRHRMLLKARFHRRQNNKKENIAVVKNALLTGDQAS